MARWVASAVIGATVLAGATSPAGANDDLAKYQGDKKNVGVTSQRSYDQEANRTTFTFTLSATQNVSHVVLMACQGIEIVSATGPNGANKEGEAPKNDPSIDDQSQHVGIKFEPGVPGAYSIVFVGNIAAADFVVKDGDGHKHFPSGAELCQPVTPAQTPDTPAAEQPSNPSNPSNPSSPSGGNTSNDSAVEGASNQTGGTGTQVAGNTQSSKPGSDVLGDQLTAPEAQATLPRTGLPVPALAPIGTMLLALGGLATALGRRCG